MEKWSENQRGQYHDRAAIGKWADQLFEPRYVKLQNEDS